MRIPVLALALMVAAAGAAGQTAAPLRVGGVVRSAVDDAPVARARVSGAGSRRLMAAVLTDDRGRFALELPAGASTSITVAAAGYATLTYPVGPRAAARGLRLVLARGAAISGRVLESSGEPAAHAAIGLSRVADAAGDLAVRFDVQADDRGEYRAGGLPDGRYVVTASRGVATTSPTIEIVARAAQETMGADLTLADEPPDSGTFANETTGAISGGVVDERGAPLQGVVVRARRVRTVSGRLATLGAGTVVRSDDRGQFRVHGLPAGDYIVAATVDARLPGRKSYVTTYVPGVVDLESATPVTLTGGSDAAGIILQMAPAVVADVTGRVRTSAGAPAASIIRMAVTGGSDRVMPEPRTAESRTDGSFTFLAVPAGDYVLQAATSVGPGAAAEFGVAVLELGGHDFGTAPPKPIEIRTLAPSALRGRLVFDDGLEIDDDRWPLRDVSMRVIPLDPDLTPVTASGNANLTMQSDGRFSIARLVGRNRIVLNDAPDGWYMKALMVDGTDASADGFDFGWTGRAYENAQLVVSRDGASVSGRPAGASLPSGAYSVIVIPADARDRITRSQYLKDADAASDGTFTVRGLPPGDYFVAAVERLDTPAGIDDWEPRELERLAASATRVTLREGETQTVRPRLIPR